MSYLVLLLFLVGCLLVGMITLGFFASHKAIHVPPYQVNVTPQDFDIPFKPWDGVGKDGARLPGWLMLPEDPAGLVFVQHGYGTGRQDPIELAQMVFRGGLAVLSFDFRGHGESPGQCTFGKQEQLDIHAILDQIGQDACLAHLPIGYLGISLGGAIGLLAAAGDQRIQALLCDASYARLGPVVARHQRLTYGLPEAPFGWMTQGCLRAVLGIRTGELDPIEAIKKLSPRPVMIIHGKADESIPVQSAIDLHEAARSPKELWLVPGAAHVASFQVAPEEYTRRATMFFKENLIRK